MSRRAYPSLREFIDLLEAENELVRITKKVSPILEITEITDRVSKMPGGGKALLFENVVGSETPVLINAFGSSRRMALALGTDTIETIAADIQAFIDMKTPESWLEKVAALPKLFKVSKAPPKIVSDNEAPCHEVVHTGADIDLSRIPVLQCWPGDAGRFVTLGATITKSLAGKRNLGVYRLQIFDRNSTGMHWHIHKDGAHAYHDYAAAGKRMEVAVVIGCDPAVVFSATAPLPPGVDELMLAGFIREKSVALVKCKTIDMEVPKTAEIVIEGYVEPGETRLEGPFGDHTGYYSLEGEYPVLHVTAITHRKDPIYLTTIVGKPPMEDCYMGKATERIFLPLLRTINPEIVDYDLPWEGVFHNCVIVSVAKRYPAQAQKLMSALWGVGQMAFAKMILAVDASVDVHDYDQVARVLLDRIDIDVSVVTSEGVLDVLDHSSPKPLHGAKIGVDVTTPLCEEARPSCESRANRNFGPFREKCHEHIGVHNCAIPYSDVNAPLAIISIDKRQAWDGHRIAREVVAGDSAEAIRIIMVVDKEVDPGDYSVALWKFFNNVDPRRDIFTENGRLFIDATKKLPDEGHLREWPDELVMTPEVVAKVDALWDGLGIG